MSRLGAAVAGVRPVQSQEMVLPSIPGLRGFGAAAERLGFEVHWTESDERDAQISALVGVVLNRAEYGQVVVLTGDRSLVDQLPRSVEVCKTIAVVPALDQR